MKAPGVVQAFRFPAGYAGTAATLRLLGQLITDRSHHPAIRARASGIVSGVPSGDWLGEMAALWDHVVGGVRYQRDPVGQEYITDPIDLGAQVEDGEAAEDCESLCAYLGSLAAAIGSVPLLVASGRPGDSPRRLRHCSLVLLSPDGSRGLAADPTAGILRGAALGDSLLRPGSPVEVWTLGGFKVNLQDQGQGLVAAMFDPEELGAFDWATGVQGALSVVGQLAPALGPYGGIVQTAASMGAQIVQSSTGVPVVPIGKLGGAPAPGARSRVTVKAPAGRAGAALMAKGGQAPAPASKISAPLAVAAGAGLLALLAVL